MAVAKLYPESPEKGGRGKTATLNVGVSGQYVLQARTVLGWLPEVADLLLAGSKAVEQTSSAATV